MKVYTIKTPDGRLIKRMEATMADEVVQYVKSHYKQYMKDYSKVAGVDVDLEKIEESMKLVSALDDYEFRTTVVEKFHDAFKMKALGQWLNKVCGKKPMKFFLQGFKSRDDLMDNRFSREKDVSEKYLIELKECVKDFFENVEVRV